jgi:hypothetical protein
MSGGVYRRNHRNIEHYQRMYRVHCSSKVRTASLPRKRRGVNKRKNVFENETLNFKNGLSQL